MVTLGAPIAGTLTVTATESIARAKRVVVAHVVAVDPANDREVSMTPTGEVIHRREQSFDLPTEGLAAGAHGFPFEIPQLVDGPPTLRADRLLIAHWIEATVEIGWAADPIGVVEIEVAAPPAAVMRAPHAFRTPRGFHPLVVLEISLAAHVIEEGDSITGLVGLRAGHGFEGLTLALVQSAGRESSLTYTVRDRARITESDLARGEPIAFALSSRRCAPTFARFGLMNALQLSVTLDGSPRVEESSCSIGLVVLPRGSSLQGDAIAAPIGAVQLRGFADRLAERVGFAVGTPPVLLEGAIGPVWIRVLYTAIDDAFEIDCSFPDVEMGIQWSAAGLLRRTSAALSPALAERYAVAYEPRTGSTPMALATRDAFVSTATSGLDRAALHLGDRHLKVECTIAGDDDTRLGVLASTIQHVGAQIAAAIEGLTFPTWMTPESVDAWTAASVERGAPLVRSGPTLWRIPLAAKLHGGGELVLFATLRTTYGEDGPSTTAVVDLPAPLPVNALTIAQALLADVRAEFPNIALNWRVATLVGREFAAAPAGVLRALDAFLSWVLSVSGLRRASAAPYR